MNTEKDVQPGAEDSTDHTVTESVLAQLSALSCWRGSIQAQVLGGGITNRNYHIVDESGEYVVRLGSDIPEHHIVRVDELAASLAAEAAGIAPAVRFHAPGVLVLDYINSSPLSPERIRDRDMLPRIVELIRRCHQNVPQYLRGGTPAFWVFHVVRDYAARIRESDSAWKSRLPDWLKILQRLESAAGPFDIVFAHNDLLAANILDDGDRLWLIDWEYAGFNTPLFDLGGLASNNELSVADERHLLELYFDEPVSARRFRQFQAMKCASLLRETLWSMVSELHSSLAFDYEQYSRDNLQRFELAMQSFDA